MLVKEAIGEVLEFLLGLPRDPLMSEIKSVATTMHSLRDPKYEYVRVRPRKDRDKERDGDKRSSVAGSIVVSKKAHRDSTTARSVAPSDSASQADAQSNATAIELPLPDSTATSPLLRTSSAVALASRTSPSSIQTPTTLQPYLESEAGDATSTMTATQPDNQIEEKKEWIGPKEESGKVPDEPEDSQTPKPIEKIPSESAGKDAASTFATLDGKPIRAIDFPIPKLTCYRTL